MESGQSDRRKTGKTTTARNRVKPQRRFHSLLLGLSAPANLLGGTNAGAGNGISGNNVGVMLWQTGAHHNRVEGNLIGTDVSGRFAVSNTWNSLTLDNAPSNTLGGASVTARNVIAASAQRGIEITGGNATGCRPMPSKENPQIVLRHFLRFLVIHSRCSGVFRDRAASSRPHREGGLVDLGEWGPPAPRQAGKTLPPAAARSLAQARHPQTRLVVSVFPVIEIPRGAGAVSADACENNQAGIA
jgi:hypothetical protein